MCDFVSFDLFIHESITTVMVVKTPITPQSETRIETQTCESKAPVFLPVMATGGKENTWLQPLLLILSYTSLGTELE